MPWKSIGSIYEHVSLLFVLLGETHWTYLTLLFALYISLISEYISLISEYHEPNRTYLDDNSISHKIKYITNKEVSSKFSDLIS